MTPEPWTTQNTPKRLEVILRVLFGTRAGKLAAKLRVHPVTMSRWRCGHRAPTRSFWETLDLLEIEAMKTYRRSNKT